MTFGVQRSAFSVQRSAFAGVVTRVTGCAPARPALHVHRTWTSKM